jgi:hypothetical protein
VLYYALYLCLNKKKWTQGGRFSNKKKPYYLRAGKSLKIFEIIAYCCDRFSTNLVEANNFKTDNYLKQWIKIK